MEIIHTSLSQPKTGPISLILLDHKSASRNGFEKVQQLRDLYKIFDVTEPSYVTISRDSLPNEEERCLAKDSNIADFLIRPFTENNVKSML